MTTFKFFVTTIYLIFSISAKAQNEITSIFIDCTEVFLDKNDKNIQTAVKNQLAKNNCIFTADKSQANWIITINSIVKSREQNQYGVYFCDAVSNLSIEHAQTGLSIHEEEISAKGGSPGSFEKAALAASKEVSENISKIILDKIFSDEFTDLKNPTLASNNRRSSVGNIPAHSVNLIITSPISPHIFSNNLQRIEFSYDSEVELGQENFIIEVDSRPAVISEFQLANGVGSFQVTLKRRKPQILTISTQSEKTGYSPPQKIMFEASSIERKFNLNILAVGINDYQNYEKLDYSVKDATNITEAFKSLNNNYYDSVYTHVILNEKATRDEIIKGLEWIQNVSSPDDVSIIYLSGHGAINKNEEFYFNPVEADPNNLRSTSIPQLEINRTFEELKRKEVKILYLVDACHSGAARKTKGQSLSAIRQETLSIESGVFCLYSSTSKQKSQEIEELQNGAMTKAILMGLEGKANDDGDNKLTVLEILNYCPNVVRDFTKGSQNPVTRTDGADFTLIVISDN